MKVRIFLSLIFFYFAQLFFTGIIAEEKKMKIFSSFSEAVPEKNGVFLLIFFSTDCAVCWDDLFEMKYFVEKNNLPVQIVGISRDSRKELERFLDKYSFNYSVVWDRKGELYNRFNVDLEPLKVILVNNKIMYKDDYYKNFSIRRKKIKECLLKIGSK